MLPEQRERVYLQARGALVTAFNERARACEVNRERAARVGRRRRRHGTHGIARRRVAAGRRGLSVGVRRRRQCERRGRALRPARERDQLVDDAKECGFTYTVEEKD